MGHSSPGVWSMAKYKTIKEIKEAFDTGTLPKGAVLIMDNDCSSMVVRSDKDDLFGEEDKEVLFEGRGYRDDIEGALDALGIPWEWC